MKLVDGKQVRTINVKTEKKELYEIDPNWYDCHLTDFGTAHTGPRPNPGSSFGESLG
jgi:hypothetical protein